MYTMNILLAAPDRDLLQCCGKILSESFGQAVTAFDGTQVLSLIQENTYDMVLLDSELPRVEHSTIIGRLNEKNIPVIVLTDRPVTVSILSREQLANAYLIYPFTPDELITAVKGVAEKAASHERFGFEDAQVDVRGSRIVGGARLTAKEIDLLRVLADSDEGVSGNRSSIGALNAKLAEAGSKVRIKYRSGKGYRPVIEND